MIIFKGLHGLLLSSTDGAHFLAGLIKKNEPLGDGSSGDTAAILGRSLTTNPGDTALRPTRIPPSPIATLKLPSGRTTALTIV
jgi:hypothetical protein